MQQYRNNTDRIRITDTNNAGTIISWKLYENAAERECIMEGTGNYESALFTRRVVV